MKTLADLKRRIKTGMAMELVHLQTNWQPGPRTVTIANHNKGVMPCLY